MSGLLRADTGAKMLALCLLLCLLPLPTAGLYAKDTGQAAAFRAGQSLAAGDTLVALRSLDTALTRDKKDGPALLARAALFLARGEGKPALRDYRAATGLADRRLRLAAWLGMSRTQRLLLHDNYRAEQACRKGLALEKDNPDLLFERALVGFAYGGGEGYSLAGESLTRLIEVDPLHCDAYRIWRDSLLGNPLDDLGRVHRGLERFLALHPDSAGWWVDIAWDDFLAGETDSALAVLERLEAARPGWNNADRELLLARCRLESGDSLVFQQHYTRALDIAAERDEYTRAFAETEVILTAAAAPRWAGCKTNRDRAAFLRWYWLDLDDDPIEPLNRRLMEHYNRLRYGQTHFSLRNPQSLSQQSEIHNRLISRQSQAYYYDPAELRRQTAILRLDPRGIVYIRMGPPEKREKHFDEGEIGEFNIAQAPPKQLPKGSITAERANNESGKASIPFMNMPLDYERNKRYRESAVIGANCEYWYYGKISLLFVDSDVAGDYVFIPQQDEKFVPNMPSLLSRERWIDPKVNYTLEYYMAQFLAPNGFDNEVEFYQDDYLPKGERPTATIAVYDSLWKQVVQREGQVYRVREGQDSDLWLALHRITVFPGTYHYTVRMASGDEKWLGKGELEFAPFAPDSLSLSAVVLGVEPAPGLESPERLDQRFVPRPGTRFGRGEPVTVYYEIYGLSPDSAGRRHYKEWIDVIRLKDGESRIKKYMGKVYQILTFNLSDPKTQIVQSFAREADWRKDRAPEMFTLDTSGLESGAYRLVIQVRDNVSQLWDVEEIFFDIQGSAEAALKP